MTENTITQPIIIQIVDDVKCIDSQQSINMEYQVGKQEQLIQDNKKMIVQDYQEQEKQQGQIVQQKNQSISQEQTHKSSKEFNNKNKQFSDNQIVPQQQIDKNTIRQQGKCQQKLIIPIVSQQILNESKNQFTRLNKKHATTADDCSTITIEKISGHRFNLKGQLKFKVEMTNNQQKIVTRDQVMMKNPRELIRYYQSVQKIILGQ